MVVRELIVALQNMPLDATIGHVWDGAIRTHINFVWLSNSGIVATADYDQRVYYECDRPVGEPDFMGTPKEQ